MKATHQIKVMGREIQVRTSASAEHVREIETFVNARVGEVEQVVKGADPHVVAILTLMNLAESYLALAPGRSSAGFDERITKLLQRLDQI